MSFGYPAFLNKLCNFVDFVDDIKPETFYYEFEEISQNAEKAEIINLPHDRVHWLAIEDFEEINRNQVPRNT